MTIVTSKLSDRTGHESNSKRTQDVGGSAPMCQADWGALYAQEGGDGLPPAGAGKRAAV